MCDVILKVVCDWLTWLQQLSCSSYAVGWADCRVQRGSSPRLEGRGSSSPSIDLDHRGSLGEGRGLNFPKILDFLPYFAKNYIRLYVVIPIVKIAPRHGTARVPSHLILLCYTCLLYLQITLWISLCGENILVFINFWEEGRVDIFLFTLILNI